MFPLFANDVSNPSAAQAQTPSPPIWVFSPFSSAADGPEEADTGAPELRIRP